MSKDTFDFTRRGLLAGAAGAAAMASLSPALITPASAKAPQLGPSRPTHYRFTLGDFEITTINDGAIPIPKVYPIFGKNQKIEDVQAFLAKNHLPPDKMSISFTPVIVNTGRQVVMFDSGYGEERRAKGAGKAAAALAAAGFTPDQIDIVVITHCHPDHVSGLMENGKAVYPNARYVTGDIEYNFWSRKELLESSDKNMARRAQAVHNNLVPLAEKATFIKPGADVVSGITSVEAFGHTPGHMCFHIESAGKRLLIFADTTNHYVVSLAKPDWHCAFDMDAEAAVVARKKILDMIATERIASAGYHMPFPSVGYVEKQGSGYRWVPVSYQFDV
ncbi:putative quorum-quenching lactonase YtnP [bacterium BMS3Bbin10]|nr:putative quorum-quenching lactonase YtnP [bacterium BMS3Bbin10]